MELPEQVQVHTGLVIIAFGKRPADDPGEIGIAPVVLGQQDQVVIAVLALSLFPVKTGAGRHIDFAAQDGPDPLRPAGPVEINDTIHNAVVRNGRGVHAEFFDSFYIFTDFVGSIQKRIFRMDMKMCKCHSRLP